MWRIVLTIVKRDLALYRRRPMDCLLPALFFIIILSLFSFAAELSSQALRDLFPTLLWIGISLSMLLSIEGLFRTDFEEGSLEQWVVMGLPLSLFVLGKLIAHWLASSLAWILISPILGLMLDYDLGKFGQFINILVLGTFSLNLVMAIGGALTLSLKRGGALLGVLVLPLVLPVILLGTSAVFALSAGISTLPYLALLAALSVITVSLAPFAIAAALKVSLEA